MNFAHVGKLALAPYKALESLRPLFKEKKYAGSHTA
ncbi:conserved protein of unknown function [Pseudomonas marincola]|uniref:Uncharacterized protein n=1 Tax=Pseudomonas marincola TaxID=437900 RepID=A0A653E8P4_9PSED|nr:conserved protein of unknown function [Pseudomonas marincola]